MTVDKSLMSGPYLSVGMKSSRMMHWVLLALFVLAMAYSFLIDSSFLWRFLLCLIMGIGLECAYTLLRDGRFQIPKASTAVTSALLILSVPAGMPFIVIFYGLIVAIIFSKMATSDTAIRLNPMLVGRLFLMLAYNEQIVSWTRKGLDIDTVTTATPLELFHAEEVVYNLSMLLRGHIGGNWEELYEMVPGSPGEIFTPLIIVLGIVLYYKGILDWRVGISFLISFAAACFFIKEPVVFNLFSGAVIFASVFIAGDPRTTPGTKAGRLIAGVIAGIANALIRKFTYYSEGIVFSFLLSNLLSPTLDRLAFKMRSKILIYRKQAQGKKSEGTLR